MDLTPYEQQALDEIARQIQVEDPLLAAGLGARPVRSNRHHGAGVALGCGFLMFLFGTVLCAVMPAVGIGISITGFLIVLVACLVMAAGPVAGPADQPGMVNRWFQDLWAAFGDPPPTDPK